MLVIAEGCSACEPLVIPSEDATTPIHASIDAPDFDYRAVPIINGERVNDCAEIWAGTPGRVLRYAAHGGRVRMCDKSAHVDRHPEWDEGMGEWVDMSDMGTVFCQLIEYDSVEIVWE